MDGTFFFSVSLQNKSHDVRRSSALDYQLSLTIAAYNVTSECQSIFVVQKAASAPP